MATSEGEVVKMISLGSNWLWESDGEIDIYPALRWRKLWCKYFGHKVEFDWWHCDRCHICIDHLKENCEY